MKTSCDIDSFVELYVNRSIKIVREAEKFSSDISRLELMSTLLLSDVASLFYLLLDDHDLLRLKGTMEKIVESKSEIPFQGFSGKINIDWGDK